MTDSVAGTSFPASSSSSGVDRRQRAFVTVSVMLATIMQAIDTTIANVALPHMQSTFGVFQDQISWVLTSYVLAAAIFIPLTGFLTAKLGRKRLFIISVVGFTIVSMMCGAAQNIYQIVLFRFLQGIFGAPLVPLSQAVMLDTYPREKQGSAMAMWGMGVMLGPVIGPTLGGWLTEYYTWRWVFYINLPIGLLTCTGLILSMRETGKDANRRFDLLGFAFLSLSIGALQMMLDRGESLNWFANTEIIIEAVLAGLFFYMFISHMLTSKHPFLDPVMFKDLNFVSGLIIMFFVGIILLAVMALLPPFMQSLLGYPVLDVGILLAPRGLGTMLGMMVMGRIVNRYDSRIFVGLGFVLLSVSLWQMTQFSADIGSGPIVVSGIVQGLGLGCIFVPLSTLAFATLPPHFRNEATPLYNLVRNLGSSIGVSVVITLLSQNTQINHAAYANYITPYSFALRESIENGILNIQTTEGLMAINAALTREGLLLAYLQDFRMMMWASLVMIPLIFFIKNPKPQSD